jgi:RPA family protein
VAGAEREVHEERLLGITDFWSRTNEIARFEKEMPEGLQRSLRAEAAEEVDGLIRDMLVLRAQQRQSKSWIGRFLTS